MSADDGTQNVSPPEVIRYYVRWYADKYNPETIITEGDRGAVVGEFEKSLIELGYDSKDMEKIHEKRRLICGFFFGAIDKPLEAMSAKNLTSAQIYALKRWVGFWKSEDGKWQHRQGFLAEFAWVRSQILLFQNMAKNRPALTIGQVCNELWPDIADRVRKSPYATERGGMVDAGLQVGGAILSESDKPFVAEKPKYVPHAEHAMPVFVNPVDTLVFAAEFDLSELL